MELYASFSREKKSYWPATSTPPDLPVASGRINNPQIPLTRQHFHKSQQVHLIRFCY